MFSPMANMTSFPSDYWMENENIWHCLGNATKYDLHFFSFKVVHKNVKKNNSNNLKKSLETDVALAHSSQSTSHVLVRPRPTTTGAQ